MQVNELINNLDKYHKQTIAYIFSQYTIYNYEVIEQLINRFQSIDLALQVALLATAEARDPLDYGLDEIIGKVADKLLKGEEDGSSDT